MNPLINATLWSLGSLAVSLLLTFVVIRIVLGQTLTLIIKEIEEDQNMAVAITFAVIALATNWYAGTAATDGFTTTGSSTTDFFWVLLGFVWAGFGATVTIWLVLRMTLVRQKSESLLSYLRREMIVENNGALALFLGVIAVSWFIQIWFQII